MTEATWGVDAIEGTLDRGLYPAAPPVLWAYKTGTTSNPDIEFTEADLEPFGDSQIYRIHQGYGTRDPFRTADGVPWDEADLEALAWTVPELTDAIAKRNNARWSTRVYASDGPFTDLMVACSQQHVDIRSVFWREANWTLSRPQALARLDGLRYAVQWASPTSNPETLIPGTTTTLKAAGLDLNVARLSGTGWRG